VTSGDTVVSPVTGSRTYTVSGMAAGTAVTIALVTPALVAGGVFTLDTGNREAVLTYGGTAGITAVNGVALGAPATAYNYTTAGTSFTFTVKGAGAATVVPVVFSNTDADGLLEVNLAGVATEPAGIGGMVTFQAAATPVPAEAADAASVGAGSLVTAVYSTGFVVAGTTGLLAFHADDVYKLNGAVITKAQFSSILGVSDVMAGITAYAQAGANTYNITTDMVATAATLNPTAVSTLGSVKVTYTTGVEGTPNSTVYQIQRRQTVTSGGAAVSGAAGLWATVKTGTVAALGTQTFTETLASGFYEYRVNAVAPAFSGTPTVTSAAPGLVTVTTSSPLTAPALLRLYLTSNATAINNLSSGDVFKVVVSTPLNTPALGATLTIGGQAITYTVATSTVANSATFAVNSAAEVVDGVSQPAGDVLTVTMLADPGAAVAFPTTLTASTGIGNSVGFLTGTGGANDSLTRDVIS
jgi:hypothetical protein